MALVGGCTIINTLNLSPATIPTLSEWAMVLLTVLFAFADFAALRKRRVRHRRFGLFSTFPGVASATLPARHRQASYGYLLRIFSVRYGGKHATTSESGMVNAALHQTLKE